MSAQARRAHRGGDDRYHCRYRPAAEQGARHHTDRHFRQLFDRWRLTRHLAAASRISAALCSSHRDAAIVLACSVAIHLITAAAAWCCAKAIASPVSFAQILFLMPPVLLIATLPVSIAGWGVRESSFMFAFAHAGLAQTDGLVISILFGALSFIIGMAGGIVWIAYGLQLRPVRESRSAEAYAENM